MPRSIDRHAEDCPCRGCLRRRGLARPTKNANVLTVRVQEVTLRWLREYPGGPAVAIEHLVAQQRLREGMRQVIDGNPL